MISKKENSGKYMQVKPALPTYHIDGCELTIVINYLVNEKGERKKIVFQSADGLCLTKDKSPNDPSDFSGLPLHPDTIPDGSAYELFCEFSENIEDTVIELNNWGITKVYLAPLSNKVIDVHTFLKKASSLSKGKSMGYDSASLEERSVIFEQKDTK